MKKYLPLIIAGLALVLAFVLSFAITRNAKIKKLRATYLPSNTAADADASDPGRSTDPADTQKGGSEDEQNTDGNEGGNETAALTKLPDPEIESMPSGDRWCLVLLNIYHKMTDSYEPRVERISEESEIRLHEDVVEHYREMAQAAAQDGITLSVDAGYIHVDTQERMFQKEVEYYTSQGMSADEAQVKAAYTVLPPGCSEANYGLSVDFAHTDDDFTATETYAWLRAHAAEYGFIERYTADKESFTHFKACPWHWRYVGVDASKYMRDYNVSLEEYVGQKD
ncbi:MAG: M15 family metallopeptidase [Clostridia bacterium]|nr:M15 family metallopeptidase [Clostridia bacterium]